MREHLWYIETKRGRFCYLPRLVLSVPKGFAVAFYPGVVGGEDFSLAVGAIALFVHHQFKSIGKGCAVCGAEGVASFGSDGDNGQCRCDVGFVAHGYIFFVLPQGIEP